MLCASVAGNKLGFCRVGQDRTDDPICRRHGRGAGDLPNPERAIMTFALPSDYDSTLDRIKDSSTSPGTPPNAG